MALDLGELSGILDMDIDPMLRALTRADQAITQFSGRAFNPLPAAAQQAAQQAGQNVTRELQQAEAGAEESGTSMGKKFAGGLKAATGAAVAAGAAVGVGFVAGVQESMERDAVEDRLAAALGGNPEKQRRYGEVAGRVYANAYGESLADVAEAVEAVSTTVPGLGAGRGLQDLTEQAYDFSTILGTEIPRSIQIAQQLVSQGLAGDVTEGFDLMLAASRRVPLAVREDLVDAVDEYAPFFAQIGYSGEEMFTLLANSSSKGMYGIDKTGDAIKEFTLLVTGDMARTKPVIEGMGLNYGAVASDLLAGGDKGVRATNMIIDGLLAIDGPAKRTREAIELFGTPLEDLGTREIPTFLESLKSGEDGLGNFQGATKRAGDTLNDNSTTNFTQFKRALQGNIVDFIDAEVLPALEDWSAGMSDEVGPATEALGDLWEDVGPVIGDVLGWIVNDLFPSMVDGATTVYEAIDDFFADIAKIVEEHPELQVMAEALGDAFAWLVEHIFPAIGWWVEHSLPVIADVLGVAADAVELLAIGFTYVGQYGAEAGGLILETFGWVFEQILIWLDETIGALPDWIPEIGGIQDAIGDARDGFSDFREGALDDIDEFSDAMKTARGALEGDFEMNGVVTIDTAQAERALGGLVATGFGLFGDGPDLSDFMDQYGGRDQAPDAPEGIGGKMPKIGNPPRRGRDNDDDPAGPATSSSSARKMGGVTAAVYVDKMMPHDYDDFRRKTDQLAYRASADGSRRTS